jgi:hypothetical protein
MANNTTTIMDTDFIRAIFELQQRRTPAPFNSGLYAPKDYPIIYPHGSLTPGQPPPYSTFVQGHFSGFYDLPTL